MAGYNNFSTDFTNIIPGKSFDIGPKFLNFNNRRNRVINISNSIISLTGQSDETQNKFYMIESLDDIQET